MNYKAYIHLMRPKHYLKNVLIFLPLVFSGNLFTQHYLTKSILSFLAFSMVASAVYTLNDINDRDVDKHHPKKRYRPIAAGTVSQSSALVLVVILLAAATLFQSLAGFTLQGVVLLLLYLSINIAYSIGLKNIPIIDVTILSLGFVIRVLYGGYSVGIDVSKWMYLAILAFSFYLGLGKRRNELMSNGTKTRKVNEYYNQAFLDKNMYVCLGLTIVYYSLWAIDPLQKHKLMYWTIPVVLMIAMSYSLTVEDSSSDGDPISVLLGNKPLLALCAFYALLVVGLIYI